MQSHKPQSVPFCGPSNSAIAETPWQHRQFILQVRHKAVMCYTESTCIVCLHEYFYIKFHLLSAGILLKVHHCTPQKLSWQIWQTPQKCSSKCLKRKSDCSKFWLSILETITCQSLCCVLFFSIDSQFKRSFLYFFLVKQRCKKTTMNATSFLRRQEIFFFSFGLAQNYTKSLVCSFLISKERSALSILLYCTMLQLHIYHNPRKVITFPKLLQKCPAAT